MIVLVSINLSSAPVLSPKERKNYHNQWVEQLLSQHHKLTDIKLFYTHLSQEKQDYYDDPLLKVQRLYQEAIHILNELENVTDKQWQSLSDQFKSTTDQIERHQDQLKQSLSAASTNWVYHSKKYCYIPHL
jgi:hypothetical protein